MKEARKFTRDNPCTKVEIHNCFWVVDKYKAQPVVHAKTQIGDNVPKYLMREGYLEEKTMGGVDFYRLTPDGEHWLRDGLKRFLELHPERISDVVSSPLKANAAPARRRIIRR